jgi:hypothetical protein
MFGTMIVEIRKVKAGFGSVMEARTGLLIATG